MFCCAHSSDSQREEQLHVLLQNAGTHKNRHLRSIQIASGQTKCKTINEPKVLMEIKVKKRGGIYTGLLKVKKFAEMKL